MRNKLFLLFFLILILMFVFGSFFTFGPRVATDFPYMSTSFLREGVNFPQLWSARTGEGLGEYVGLTLWAWPMDLVYGIGGSLGISFSIMERLFGVFLILALGIFSINKFLTEQKIGKEGKFVGSLFFLLNSYIILLIDGGQFAVGLAYAWFPLAFTLIQKSLLTKDLKQIILTGISVAVLGFFDLRFIYILFILVLIYIIYTFSIKGWPRKGILVLVIFAVLNFYWIFPAIASLSTSSSWFTRQVSDFNLTSLINLGHSLTFLQPHWYQNVFGQVSQLRWEFILLPILVFLAPILRRKDRTVGFWLIVTIIGVFLIKGSSEPLAGLYNFLFTNVPGFLLFRDPTKFFFLTALSFSFLIAVSSEELIKRFRYSHFLIAFYIFLLAWPVYTGKMTGTFSRPIYQNEFYGIEKVFETDDSFARIAWFPSRAPLGYSSPNHPALEGLRLINKRPFVAGIVGTYELFNFLREAPFMGEIFKVIGTKYLVFPYPDSRGRQLKDEEVKYYHIFVDQIKSLPWIGQQISGFPLTVFKTKKFKDHFFITSKTWLVLGSDDFYTELVKVPNFDLSDNALIFAEEYLNLDAIVNKEVISGVILNNKTNWDLAIAMIDSKNLIAPAANLNVDPDESGWWKREANAFLNWRAFLQEKYRIDNLDFSYGIGWAVAEGNKELKIESSELKDGDILITRVMRSSRGGKVSFWQNEQKVGEINTLIDEPEKREIKLTGYKEIPDQIFEYDKANVSWLEVGELVTGESIIIRTEGEINVINSLLSISKGEWEQAKQEAQNLINKQKVYKWEELADPEKEKLFMSHNDYKIAYERLGPTHYKVAITGIKTPATLIFSEAFDPLWQLDNTGPYPAYSLVNGFEIFKDGHYDVYYKPQKYIAPALMVSIFAFFELLILLLIV